MRVSQRAFWRGKQSRGGCSDWKDGERPQGDVKPSGERCWSITEGRKQEKVTGSYVKSEGLITSPCEWKQCSEIATQSHVEGRWKHRVSSGKIQRLEKDLRVLGIDCGDWGDKNGTCSGGRLSGEDRSVSLRCVFLRNVFFQGMFCAGSMMKEFGLNRD